MASAAAGNGETGEIDFASQVLNHFATTNSVDNFLISPLLLEAALALLYLGSDGATAEELKRILQLQRYSSNAKMANYYAYNLESITQEADTKVQLCSRILLSKGVAVAEEFQKIAQKYFQTDTVTCNLQHQRDVEKQLNETVSIISMQINENLAELEAASGTAIFLLAANFKYKWFLPFSAYRSGTYEFHTPTDTTVVPMLFDDDMLVKFGEFRELDARAIELPYEHDEELAMLLLLPNKRDGLSSLEQSLSSTQLSTLAERMQMESVQVLLPKFKLEFECSLKSCLEKLGINSIFSNAANFKNLMNAEANQPLKVADILHKVCLEVNESGSDPSSFAANKPIMLSNSHKNFFRADHAFFFAIRFRHTNFFMGHVVNV